MSEKLYTYSANLGERTYKFFIHAESRSMADERVNKFIGLYKTIAYDFDKEVLRLGVEFDEFSGGSTIEKAKEKINALNQFEQNFQNLNFSVQDTVEKNEDETIYERDGRGILSISNGNKFVDSIDIDFNNLSNFSNSRDKKFRSLVFTNSEQTRQNVLKFINEFSRFVFDGRLNYDAASLKPVYDRLHKQYLSSPLFDSGYLDKQIYASYQQVRDLIKPFAISKSVSQMTRLMTLASRDFNLVCNIPNTLNNSESEIRQEVLRGADINATDIQGRTALMYVVLGIKILDFCSKEVPGRERFAKLFLELGADPMIEDKCGMTALDYFKYYAGASHPSVHVLEEAMQSVSSLKM